MLSRCAARITRHRAISLRTASLTFLVATFVQDMLSRSAENKNAKNESFAIAFAVFLDVRITIFRDLGRSRWALLTILLIEDFEDCCDLGGVSPTKLEFHFDVQIELIFVFCCIDF